MSTLDGLCTRYGTLVILLSGSAPSVAPPVSCTLLVLFGSRMGREVQDRYLTPLCIIGGRVSPKADLIRYALQRGMVLPAG